MSEIGFRVALRDGIADEIFLASDLASGITGEDLSVFAGQAMYRERGE